MAEKYTLLGIRGLSCLTALSTIFQLYCGCQLLVEQTGLPWENHRPAASHWQLLSHDVVLSTPRHAWGSNPQCQWLSVKWIPKQWKIIKNTVITCYHILHTITYQNVGWQCINKYVFLRDKKNLSSKHLQIFCDGCFVCQLLTIKMYCNIGLCLWCLMPLLTIFQLYRDDLQYKIEINGS
jgi:hypothetical protein